MLTYNHKPYLVAQALSLVILSIGCSNTKTNNLPAKEKVEIEDTIQPLPANRTMPGTISLAFVGDVMMGTNVPDTFVTADRGATLFAECDTLLRNADIAIANLESTCYDGSAGETKKNLKSKNCYVFRTPADHAKRLADAGIDAVNMANNHSNDFGDIGRELTINSVKGVGIQPVGLRDLCECAIIDRKGVRCAYLGFAASCKGTLDVNDSTEIEAMVTKYRKLADILIVTFHGGAEGVAHQHITHDMEMFLGEERGNVHDFAHYCIDLGADIVVGHGPHVPRAMELYKGHLIAYSLGNFCTPYRVNIKGVSGYAPLLRVNINPKDGKLQDGRIYSFLQRYAAGPRRDNTNAAAMNIRQLTREDFPNTQLHIDKNGILSILNK